MTDLFLSEESKEYQALARDFFQNEVATRSEKLDHDGVFPHDLYKAAWELGLATYLIPESYGGLGLSLWDSVVMAEEAGAASGGFASAFEGNALAAASVISAGTDNQKKDYLGRLAEEACLAAFCFEPSASDKYPSGSAQLKVLGNNFELSAENLVAINGELAGWYFVLAADTNNELTAFVVPADLPGIVRGAQLSKLGRTCADICTIKLEQVQLTKAHLLGEIGQGESVILDSSCIGAPIVAAHATGLMRSALEHSVRYSKERQTFGKPIAKHQAVAFMLADMAKDTECARLMTWKAACLFDKGMANHINAISAKVFAVDAAMAAATDAVQIFGGYGYSKEYPVERLMRDAKMMQMMAGTSYELKCRIGEEQLALS